MTEVLVCSIVMHVVRNDTTYARVRFLRLALPASYLVVALAWAPTQGQLDGQGAYDVAIVTALAINLALSLALGVLLLATRADVRGSTRWTSPS